MKNFKFLLLILFLPLTGLMAHDSSNTIKNSLKCCTSSTDGFATIASFDFAQLVAERDATFVAQKGLFSFFTGALKAVAVWAGVKLTKWVLGKINRRASTYSERYYSDPGVYQASQHWDDMMQRSGSNSCRIGPEPDHDTSQPGFQDTDDCPICKKQALDLKNT